MEQSQQVTITAEQRSQIIQAINGGHDLSSILTELGITQLSQISDPELGRFLTEFSQSGQMPMAMMTPLPES